MLQLNQINGRWQHCTFFSISEDGFLSRPSVAIAFTIQCFSVMANVWITRSQSFSEIERKHHRKMREKQLCSLNILFFLSFFLFKILETAHENLFLLRSSPIRYSFIKIHNSFLLFIFSNVMWFQGEMIMIGGRERIIRETGNKDRVFI